MLVSADRDPRKAGTIWAINLGGELPLTQPLCPVTFSLVEPGSVGALANAMGENSLPEILKRFEAGRRCYAAWVNNELASYGWVSFDEELVGELNLRLHLLPGEAYIWDCATLPAHRQKHLYSALLTHILADLSDSGKVCRVWIGADLDNIASQRGIARAGFHRVANLLVERFLTLRLVWAQADPGVPESWVKEARRVYLGNRDSLWLEALEHSRQIQLPK